MQESGASGEMESESVKTKPETYIFNGFFGFVLFGPFRSCFSDCLAFLEEDDIGNKADGNNMPSHHAAHKLAIKNQALQTSTNVSRKRKQNPLLDPIAEAQHVDAIADLASAHCLTASAKMMDSSVRMLEKRLELANNKKNQALKT